jgi:AhpD family alkylhydroperoxidase
MITYSESTDKRFAKDIIRGAPRQSKAWLQFDSEVGEVESAIPSKYKELISIGISLTTQCPYCIEKHVKKAREHGATQEEIAETIMITAALRSGAAMGHGLLAMKLFNEGE